MHDNIIEMKIWNILISQIYVVRFPMKNILDVNNYIYNVYTNNWRMLM